jgi:hypothetical protein
MAGYLKAENGVMISFEDGNEFPQITGVSKTPVWVSQNTITSFSPIIGFSYTNAFTFTLTIRFSIEEGSTIRRVHWCRSLGVPDYANGSYRPPAVVITIEKYIELFQGVCNSITEAIPDDAVWIDGEPSIVEVTLGFEECATIIQHNLYSKSYGTINEQTA